jgi:hypothetical protein
MFIRTREKSKKLMNLLLSRLDTDTDVKRERTREIIYLISMFFLMFFSMELFGTYYDDLKEIENIYIKLLPIFLLIGFNIYGGNEIYWSIIVLSNLKYLNDQEIIELNNKHRGNKWILEEALYPLNRKPIMLDTVYISNRMYESKQEYEAQQAQQILAGQTE